MEQIRCAAFGWQELVIILAIVMVIFGASRLPQIGEGLGKAIRNFRKSFRDKPRDVSGEVQRIEDQPRAEQLPPGQSGMGSTNQEVQQEVAEKQK